MHERAFRYRLYGMDFATGEAIAGVSESSDYAGERPVTVEFGPVPERLDRVEARNSWVEANGREYLLSFDDRIRLLARDGDHVVVEPGPLSHPLHFRQLALDAAATLTGFQRGHYPFHASAVLTPAGAIAFCGLSGAGKSTLLAGLIGRGFHMLSDDLCLIRKRGDFYVIGEGPPTLRLMPDAVARMKLSGGAEDERTAKTHLRLGAGLAREAPLARAYFLTFSGAPGEAGIEPLSARQAMTALAASSRMWLRLDALPRDVRAATFSRLAGIAGEVPFFGFTRPRDPEWFEAGLDALIEHMSHASGNPL